MCNSFLGVIAISVGREGPKVHLLPQMVTFCRVSCGTNICATCHTLPAPLGALMNMTCSAESCSQVFKLQGVGSNTEASTRCTVLSQLAANPPCQASLGSIR